MLINVVLPAPLVPIRPTTVSFSIAALTSLAAVTAPKRLHSPRASRMAGITRAHFAYQRPEALRQEDDDDEQRGAERELPGVRRQVVRGGVDDLVDERAGERRHHAAGAGEDGDEDELAGGCPERHIRIDVPDGGRGERTADTGKHRGDDVDDVHGVARRRP